MERYRNAQSPNYRYIPKSPQTASSIPVKIKV